jgi:hypothetical protein
MRNAGVIHLYRSLAIPMAGLPMACGGGEQAARDGDAAAPTAAQQVALPKALCELLPRADAEQIMGKPLVEQRNDEWACHYQNAADTTGTGLTLDLNAFEVTAPGQDRTSELATSVAKLVLAGSKQS